MSAGCVPNRSSAPPERGVDTHLEAIPSIVNAIRKDGGYYPIPDSRGIEIRNGSIFIRDARLSFRLPPSYSNGPEKTYSISGDYRNFIILSQQNPNREAGVKISGIGVFIEDMPVECDALCVGTTRISQIDLPYIDSIFLRQNSSIPVDRSMGLRCRLKDENRKHLLNILFITNQGAAVTIMMENAGYENSLFQNEFNRMIESITYTDLEPRCERTFESISSEAKRGVLYHQVHLARMYMMGLCVPQSYPDALKWLEIASYSGNDEAAFLLGIMHRDGLGTPINPVKANLLFQRAADRGHPPALIHFAKKLLADKSSPDNSEKAIQLLRKASDDGSTEAMYILGMLNDSGDLMQQNHKRAMNLFHQAAQKGNGAAQLHLGRIFAEGKLVNADRPLAHAWYTIASANNCSPALKERHSLEKDMNPIELDEAQIRIKTMLANNQELLHLGRYNFFDNFFY
jgi:TPR repeat protein